MARDRSRPYVPHPVRAIYSQSLMLEIISDWLVPNKSDIGSNAALFEYFMFSIQAIFFLILCWFFVILLLSISVTNQFNS